MVGSAIVNSAARTAPWPAGTATAVGSMPGTDPVEAARTVLGELPDLPHLPELPARGLGADLIGRAAGLLVSMPFESVPSGYRLTGRPGADHRRAVDLHHRDLDGLDQALQEAGHRPPLLKVQVAGPWTLAAGLELPRGHRVLTDQGALRDLTESLLEGLRDHLGELRSRTGADLVVQFDEPTLPAVLRGSLPTPSGYGTVSAVSEPDAVRLLHEVVETTREVTGAPVFAHCCARRPPVRLFAEAGVDVVSFDAASLDGADTAFWDELGETWDGGTRLALGLVPGTPPTGPLDLRSAAAPALAVADRLGFARPRLADLLVPATACGLAGATRDWARTALTLVRDLGRAFVEPPESWGG
ncbi:methionine synthase [Actinoalloteichus caeruleus]|uniref:methionine synthase n=1 Tax=Actinoalloteichus cyanogriseus TaxID=2893586 RepID=UPI0009DD9BE1